DQEYLAVRLQGTEDLRGALAGDAVQHTTGGALLDEPRELTRHDRKALPVENGAGGIRDQQLIAGSGGADLAGDDLHTGRVRKGPGSQDETQNTSQRLAHVSFRFHGHQ